MFVDKVKIKIAGGDGGSGFVSFHRAKYVLNGGPDGGDGGRGGAIIFEACPNMATLLDFRYKRSFIAQPGESGKKNNRTGKSAEDVVIKVPVGTIVREVETDLVMLDLKEAGERRVLIKGGRGGRGNQHFATAARQAPRYAERGRSSKSYEVVLELKTLADVGLVGMPNVGKSTILSMVTNANPKIANYHFTTLSPNLGVVRNAKGQDFVLADIPGLVEGASEGVGLGIDFLRHVERCKVFIHVTDASGMEGTSPVDAINIINKEIFGYDEGLRNRPQIVAANKMDVLPEAAENLPAIKKLCKENNWQLFEVSAASNQGLDGLMEAAFEILEDIPDAPIAFEEDYVEREPDHDNAPFTVTAIEDDYFVVEGVGVEKMVGYTNLETEKGNAFFQKYLKDKGIVAKLEEMGIEEGHTVRIYDLEFEYFK
ncbi:MAG: GTPase ObgE [Defluviitaleaceae bacterium]|nr:GTPase ObgE [Defluviitaleaceae bacterium]